ncbi:DUF3306 domain-containing protein [Vibrio sp. Isolate31]|uniref:DUF3306 domain-containing protein n=1 Tax=unclassified Vibrio TaxID=2614977 RepID=UPI001EFD2067|nr:MULTISPECIES: DUF3306 domain-containing protein [unclassified Vibrio]MCG9552449.1 DUF3306 domain-containing protein [Vibrio sp. Isolate32]MCG9600700.1 DUF3306 domain-containing protein [Vibrio sp. Isolate31]
MATNFFSRWSQRKLDESTDKALEAEQPLEETSVTSSESALQIRTSAEELAPDDPASTELTEALEDAADTEGPASEATEELSMAQLLVSEASESVKKAALRKLFLSEEFNVRDGLDDYDDDYSNLKSLSEGVAESLRDWLKEKSEEEMSSEQEQVTESREKDSVNNAEEAESDLVESGEIAGQQKGLCKNTVSNDIDTDAIENDPKEVEQNIPRKE